MNLSDIPAWLASAHDFRQGAALYAALGPSPVYKRLFALPASEDSRAVLLRELSALVRPERAAVASQVPEPVPPTAPASSEAAPLLLELAQQLKAVRDERSHLHPQLTASGLRKTARRQLAGRIVALTDQEVAIQARAAHVRQHGRLPGPVPAAQVTDPGELRRLLTNRRAQRSKLKKDPARAADLARVQADIDLLTQKLAS